MWHGRCRNQVAGQIEDVLQVILLANSRQSVVDDALPVVVSQANGPADATVQAIEFSKLDQPDAFDNVSLDEAEWRSARADLPGSLADV